MHKINTICKFCKIKVNKCNAEFDGYMEIYNSEYHFKCVKKYGYQLFCNEVLKYKNSEVSIEEINKILNNVFRIDS